MKQPEPWDRWGLMTLCFDTLPNLVRQCVECGNYIAAECFLEAQKHFLQAIVAREAAWRDDMQRLMPNQPPGDELNHGGAAPSRELNA